MSLFCQALLPNLAGTDYFVGDIHGQYDRLAEALNAAGFEPLRDRLIAVGDLVDRGPYSTLALEWMRQPFFHSIRGNHEDLFLQWYALREDKVAQAKFAERVYYRNGGQWVEEVDEATLAALAQALSTLPYFLAVSMADGRTIGVVHAELPDGSAWPMLLTQMDDRRLLHAMSWGRERIRAARGHGAVAGDGNQIAGLDALVCGHFVVPEPTLLGNCVYLDTGGWRPGGHFSLLSGQEVLQMAGEKADH